MEWNIQGGRPIYAQLIEQVTLAIVSGVYAPGERLASVRELAMQAGVNPNTMQRALAQMEEQGLLYTQRTAGRFVTEDVSVIRQARQRLAVLKNNSDGFAIAESDLKLRGGGDFMGTRQSGRSAGDIKNLNFPVSAIFTAKSISDDAFSGGFYTASLREAAMRKYNKLKDVILN